MEPKLPLSDTINALVRAGLQPDIRELHFSQQQCPSCSTNTLYSSLGEYMVIEFVSPSLYQSMSDKVLLRKALAIAFFISERLDWAADPGTAWDVLKETFHIPDGIVSDAHETRQRPSSGRVPMAGGRVSKGANGNVSSLGPKKNDGFSGGGDRNPGGGKGGGDDGNKSKLQKKVCDHFFACPWAVADPENHPACLRARISRFGDLLQHIRRYHVRDANLYCPNCRNSFASSALRDEHWNTCTTQNLVRSNIISNADVQRFGQLARVSGRAGNEERWYVIFAHVFPNNQPPRTPYINAEYLVNVENLYNGLLARGHLQEPARQAPAQQGLMPLQGGIVGLLQLRFRVPSDHPAMAQFLNDLAQLVPNPTTNDTSEQQPQNVGSSQNSQSLIEGPEFTRTLPYRSQPLQQGTPGNVIDWDAYVHTHEADGHYIDPAALTPVTRGVNAHTEEVLYNEDTDDSSSLDGN